MDHFGKPKIKADTSDTILSELYEHVKNYATLRRNSKGSQEWLSKIDLKGFETALQRLTGKKDPKGTTYARKDGMTALLKEINGLTEYELPDYLLGKIWKGKYRGQKQKWFIVRFLGKDQEINLKTNQQEFIEWKWIKAEDLPNVIVHFKKKLYESLLPEIKKIID